MKAYELVIIYTFDDGTQLMLEGGSLPNPSEADTLEVVKEDESLVDISFAHYGTHDDWVTIGYSNGIIDPWSDLVGTTLIIPAL